MSKLFSNILFSFFLLFQTASFAEEGDIERLVVPEIQDEHAPSDDQETIDTDESQEEEVTHEENAPQTDTEVTEITTSEAPAQTHQEEVTEVHDEAEASPEVIDNVDEEIVQEKETEVQPSEEELEAKHAEEAELREVGAGEEPVIEE